MSPIGVATGAEAVTSSHIEEMIQELAQLEGFEVLATGMLLEGITIVVGEPSSQSSLPKDSPSSDPQLSKRTRILHILPLSSLLLTSML